MTEHLYQQEEGFGTGQSSVDPCFSQLLWTDPMDLDSHLFPLPWNGCVSDGLWIDHPNDFAGHLLCPWLRRDVEVPETLHGLVRLLLPPDFDFFGNHSLGIGRLP